MKIADISRDSVLQFVAAAGPIGADWLKYAKKHPEYPDRLVLAKFRAMVKKKLLDGCCCGCRGDFTLGPRAMEMILSDYASMSTAIVLDRDRYLRHNKV